METTNKITQGFKVVVFFGLLCYIEASDNGLRISLNDGSATEGRIEIFHDGAWGAVCDDDFGMEEAKTACIQLGYDTAVGYITKIGEGVSTYFIDDLDCLSNHTRLHHCKHGGWMIHNCGYVEKDEKTGVKCHGGNRQVVAYLIQRADYYWNCDEFVTGVPYDIRKGHSAVVHGTASFVRSPIDSGFKIKGQSSWVELGDFSSEPCLVDPSTCFIYVSAWFKFARLSHHEMYLIGNRYNGQRFRGFNIRIKGNRLEGTIRSSSTNCNFWDLHVQSGIWVHLAMGWNPPGTDFFIYIQGNWHNKRGCNNQGLNRTNHVYTIGADESLAGNANRDLDVAIDELVIMFSAMQGNERAAPYHLATDFDGFSINKLTIKLPDIPWDATYSESTSSAYTTLKENIKKLTQEIYSDYKIGFQSFKLENLQDNNGDLQLTLVLNFSKVSWQNGVNLYRTFILGKFLNTTPEVLGCESNFQSCTNIALDSAAPSHDVNIADVYFYPVQEHLDDTYYGGYHIVAFKINGTKDDVWLGWANPNNINLAHGQVRCGPDKTVALCVQLKTFKGGGFPCSNYKIIRIPEGPPSEGPQNVRYTSLTAFNVTVSWGEINPSKRNGIIQKYKVQLNNPHNQYMASIYLLVNETRRASFYILQPSKRHIIYVCGYTSYHQCGSWSNTGWFHALALLPGKAPRPTEVEANVHSALLKWNVVDPDYQYGKMISHPILVRNMRTGEIDFSHEFPVTDQSKADYSVDLLDLKGLTNYHVNLSLVNEVGEGPRASIAFTTLEGVPTAYPQNVTAVNITADRVILKWDAIDIEDTNGILLGYQVFYKLADLDGPWYNVSVSNLTAQIPVLSLRTYNVNVAGFTAVGDGVWSPPLLINTTGIKPTNVSSGITVTNATNDTLLVEWRYFTAHDKPAQSFVVTATRNDTNITEASQILDVLFWSEDVFWITLKGLKEFKWYIIQVAAGNLMGMGPFSDQLILGQTLEGVPSAAPRNLTATNSSSRSILLQWKPVLYEYADGIIRGHKVFWRLANTFDIWQVLYVNGTDNTTADITDLEKFTDYEFKILAFTSLGESVSTNSVIARTDEDVPLHPPLNVYAYNTSSRSLRVTWKPVPPQWHFGIIRGYQVVIMDTRDGREYIDNVPVGMNRTLERAGFERYTNYTVKIAAYTVKGLGNFSEPFLVITDEDVPSEAPPNMQCDHINSTSLQMKWSVLPVVKAHGVVRTYLIFLERNDGRYVELYNDTQPATSFNTSFHGLDENVEYSMQMLATTIKGEGVKSDPLLCETDEDVPHGTPQDLNGYNTSDTSIKIFWQEVPFDDQNGVITGYTVFYNTTLRSGINDQREKSLRVILHTVLSGLLPFKYYDIQVAAWTAKGMGPKCNVTAILTEEEAPKIAPSEVRAFNTSSTSIRLTWRPIPPEDVGGILRGYKIFWEEVNYLGAVILQNQTQLNNPSYEFLDFLGLTKFQEYRFSILAFTKFDGVESPVVSAMTDEDIPTLPPSYCAGFNISKNEIHISWDVVPRPDRNGIILGYNIYTYEVFNYFATMPADYIAPNKPVVINTTGPSARSFIPHNLVPYTDYSFQLDAFTSKGNGPKCSAFIVRTEEEAPLYSPGNISLHNTSSTSINVAWDGLDLLIIRGVFLGYEIWFTAHPQFPQAYLRYGNPESKRKRRAVFTLDKQITTAGVTKESIEITGLAKYTNYTVQVIGFTKFLGAQSGVFRVITDEDIPSKPPQDFKGANLSSSTIFVEWKPVEDGFVHGILLGYRIYYRLTTAPLMPPFNVTLAPDQLHTLVEGLFLFTNYTFQITAFTSKGEGRLSEEVVISTDEDVASKSPFGFKVVNLFHMHEIPMSWNPVPEGYLNGILTGYRIKMRMTSDAMLDVNGAERHIDVDSETLSYTVRKLPNFATYKFQIVALTKYGEGVHSPVRTAKTCPCEKYLTTNWYMLPPYTNRTGDQETGIFPWLLNNLVKECCGNCRSGHGWSEILYKTDGYGLDGYKREISEFSAIINEDTDFHFPVQGHPLLEKFRTFYAYVYSIASPGVAFFIVDDPPDAMPNAILATVSSSWGLLMMAVIFSFVAGVFMWFLDAGTNEMEFPKRFYTGSGEGFWWAFISMTTVGYGDRSPRSVGARLFAMFWVLAGLVLASIMMGSITNALTTVTFSVKSIKLYGTKVAAIDGSPSYRVGIRRNAKVNQDNVYHDAYELQYDLRERNVKGALLDGYMAGSYNELFEDERIRVKEIIDYNNGYGIVLGGIHHRLQRCFKNFVKRKRSFIVDYVATQIKTVRKNPKSPEEAKSTNLFNPKADIFVKSMIATLAMSIAAIIVGFCLQFYFKKRFRAKVKDSTEAKNKNILEHTSEILETFSTRISALKKELYYKHTNEFRALSGLKRRSVRYEVLREMKEELENKALKDMNSLYNDMHDNTFTSKTLLISSSSNSTTLNKIYSESSINTDVTNNDVTQCNDPTQFDDVITLNNIEASGSLNGYFNEVMLDESIKSTARLTSPAIESQIELEMKSALVTPQVEARPDVKDLQREAYLAGLKAEQKDESGHPFSKMYRCLWIEK